MRRALDLAERGWGRVSPNPMVGAVVVSAAGDVVGEGWHEGPGTPHAEAMALERSGDRARGATIICTLEPCDRYGRTPPCTEALIRAGVARVVVAATDPNLGAGAPGLAALRAAGIDVVSGVLQDESRRSNEAFERHVLTGKPFVVLKSAASLDGKTAAADGSSAWITSADARSDAQRLRAWADAIAIGSRTAIADDPALTVRDPRFPAARPPLRVVLDGHGHVEPEGRIFSDAAPTMIATSDATPESRIREWERAGAEVAVLERADDGTVSLRHLLDVLGKRDVQGLLVEGGATLAWSFVREGFVDRVVLYLAPSIIGGASAPGVIGGSGFAPLDAAPRLEIERIERIGPDLKVEARVHGDR